MKRISLALLVIALGTSAMAFDYLGPTNEANRNFSPLIQHQFEKQETLDFINNPSEYKAKREKKDAYLDYKEGKTNGEIPAALKPQINVKSNSSTSSNVQFIKGEDGQIKIQEIK
jgi:hypothetical protein